VICERGDVVVVPFPFLERPVSKRRPALVCSQRAFNESNRHSIFAMITTGAHSSWPSDLPITDGTSAGLDHTSIVRMKLFTLPNDFIIRKLGDLSRWDTVALSKLTGTIFGEH